MPTTFKAVPCTVCSSCLAVHLVFVCKEQDVVALAALTHVSFRNSQLSDTCTIPGGMLIWYFY